MYTQPSTNSQIKKYMAMIESLDYEVGRLLNSLTPTEKANTTIIFIGDNGTPNNLLQDYPANHGKQTLYQGGIHVPMFISGYGVTLGGYAAADLENAEYIIMAGANRAEAIVTPDTMDGFKRTKGRGAKLICIDPRFTNTAAKADKWFAITPGTDLAFVLALTYVVLTEELYNQKYVAENFNGFEEYKNSVLTNKYYFDQY
jgi:thiosulfate reductase/polysulfide reductase chain A